jgi:hypothetical protein
VQHTQCNQKGSPDAEVKLLPHDQLAMRSWVQVLKQPLAEMQDKAAYIRPKVVRSFSRLYASRSYMHQAAPLFYFIFELGQTPPQQETGPAPFFILSVIRSIFNKKRFHIQFSPSPILLGRLPNRK